MGSKQTAKLPSPQEPVRSNFFSRWGGTIAVVLACAVIIVLPSYFMYHYTQTLLHERLRERLVAITSTAALYFDAEEMRALRREVERYGENVITHPLYREIISKLNDVRDTNENIQYVYLFGKTETPHELIFLADADVTEDLVLEEGDEGNDFPGSIYDASEAPELFMNGFRFPTADSELIPDEWGVLLAGYAPIFDEEGEADAVLGIDVDVTEYIKIVNATFLPFTLFVVLLLLIISLLTVMIVRMWASRVRFFQELDRQKDELLSMVSHQLATPISSIKWIIEMVLDGDTGKLGAGIGKELKKVQVAAADLTDLVGMILDVSRIQLGRLQVNRAPIHLGEFFSEVIDGIKPQAAKRKVRFTVQVPDHVPTTNLDRRLMRMTLENLLSNAIKYTPAGKTVDFVAHVSQRTLRYEVRDTGCGIPAEDQNQIFGRLFRASNVQDTDGNGFGLYVAKGAVDAQGGKIWFKSRVGEGTTFFVELPLPPVEKKRKAR